MMLRPLRLLIAATLAACSSTHVNGDAPSGPARAEPTGTRARGDPKAVRAEERARMVLKQIEPRGVEDPRVLAAMRAVPRHEFVPQNAARLAYRDRPLPIGQGQTISQPYIVAAMTELAEIEPGDAVLEVGTGSGYQAAILDTLGATVFSIEIVRDLAKTAKARLARLGYERVTVRHGDGYAGWPEHAPFDAIVVTAAPPRIPEPLKQQLKVGGRMVVPVGDTFQELVVLTRTPDGYARKRVFPVRFVPMTGQAQEDR